MIDRMDLRASARVAGVGCVIAIVVFSLLPGHQRPDILHNGNLEHFAAYAGTAFLLVFGFTRRFAWAHISALSAASALFEILQIWIPGRHAGVDNWLASSAGAVVGAVLAFHMSRYASRKSG
ncbi:VanZ family protein [Siculibacillus lacustris]|uniref:VanZ family protein n=1 Tax=Siculibacillus lacustris TaxID=1549641 RepID=UPI0013F14A8A|nr:VanZ family protein [Siculibacillus lacustris]